MWNKSYTPGAYPILGFIVPSVVSWRPSVSSGSCPEHEGNEAVAERFGLATTRTGSPPCGMGDDGR